MSNEANKESLLIVPSIIFDTMGCSSERHTGLTPIYRVSFVLVKI